MLLFIFPINIYWMMYGGYRCMNSKCRSTDLSWSMKIKYIWNMSLLESKKFFKMSVGSLKELTLNLFLYLLAKLWLFKYRGKKTQWFLVHGSIFSKKCIITKKNVKCSNVCLKTKVTIIRSFKVSVTWK